MYYYLYQITNIVNSKIYVGIHMTSNLNDNYMGSGKILRKAIAKYGIENFEKVILEFFVNAELMYAREREVVNEYFLKRKDVYNLNLGGNGGWNYINNLPTSKESKSIACIKSNQSESKRLATKLRQSGIPRERKWDKGCDWTGRKHTEETKLKMSKVDRSKENNSQYGTMWITNPDLKENKKVKIDSMIPEGWLKGRKFYK